MAVRAWPDVSATGRSYRRAAAVKRRQNAGRRLGRLLQSLPTRNDTDNAADEYLAVLERALEDREISEEELDALQEVARDLDMDRDEVRRAHRELLSDLIRVAWLDETITEAEQRDIEQVAGLLDIGGDEYIRMIEETQAEPTTPVASPADHPREDLAGLRVCFTGASEAILDGKPVTRSELKDLATERGMAVQPRVTKKLDLLVCADPKSQSSKARKARQYGVRIMAESAFLRYVGV
jgi:DNA polymerase-3 subunit epsilon